MVRLSRVPLTAALATLAACALEQAPSEPDPEKQEMLCTLAGCGPAFELRALLDVSFELVQAAEVRVCRNDECRRGRFRSDAAARQASADVEASSDSGAGAATIWVNVSRNASERLLFELYWSNWDWSQPLQAGPDLYEVTIEADGMTLYSTSKTVTEYALRYPNGPKCGPTCSYVSFVDD